MKYQRRRKHTTAVVLLTREDRGLKVAPELCRRPQHARVCEVTHGIELWEFVWEGCQQYGELGRGFLLKAAAVSIQPVSVHTQQRPEADAHTITYNHNHIQTQGTCTRHTHLIQVVLHGRAGQQHAAGAGNAGQGAVGQRLVVLQTVSLKGVRVD